MSEVHRSGTYTVKLNDSGKPSLYAADGTTPIDNPMFETFGDEKVAFKILDTSDLKDPLLFSEPPITWSEPDPPGNTVSLEDGDTALALAVSHPASWQESQGYHFQLHLNQGDIDFVLWSDDGTVILDPTIIENPPNG